MIARGARAIGYWHWHTMHASWETFWGGILPHRFVPGRVYDQIGEFGREIAAAGAAVEGIVPDAGRRPGLLHALAVVLRVPPSDAVARLGSRKQGRPDRAAYERIVYRFYGGLDRAGLEVRMMACRADWWNRTRPSSHRSLPVLVVPALVIADDATTRWLSDYAEAGGHLVLGIRTALLPTRTAGSELTSSLPASPRPRASGTTSSAICWRR